MTVTDQVRLTCMSARAPTWLFHPAAGNRIAAAGGAKRRRHAMS